MAHFGHVVGDIGVLHLILAVPGVLRIWVLDHDLRLDYRLRLGGDPLETLVLDVGGLAHLQAEFHFDAPRSRHAHAPRVVHQVAQMAHDPPRVAAGLIEQIVDDMLRGSPAHPGRQSHPALDQVLHFGALQRLEGISDINLLHQVLREGAQLPGSDGDQHQRAEASEHGHQVGHCGGQIRTRDMGEIEGDHRHVPRT